MCKNNCIHKLDLHHSNGTCMYVYYVPYLYNLNTYNILVRRTACKQWPIFSPQGDNTGKYKEEEKKTTRIHYSLYFNFNAELSHDFVTLSRKCIALVISSVNIWHWRRKTMKLYFNLQIKHSSYIHFSCFAPFPAV